MVNGLLGKKIGMTQIFKETGEHIPVTVIEAGPCPVLQAKTADKDSYNAVKLGFDNRQKEKNVTKPEMGTFKKSGIKPVWFIKEIRTDSIEGIKPADNVTVDIFTVGEYVNVTGTSIGKGFAGGVKRWNWRGGPRTHGSMSHRRIGSVGSNTDPGRILKGLHMPGHMGDARVTVHNLEIVEVDKESNLLLLKGAVPGGRGSYLIITKSFKKKKKEPKVVLVKKEKDALKESKRSMKKIIKEKKK